MLIFLDTEFTGLDQIKPDLISIGLVDETGREFYAELPHRSYQSQLTDWTRQNVVSHLWAGKYIQTPSQISGRLAPWIAACGKATVVSDCPSADFPFLRALLPVWPKRLAKVAAAFEVQQPVIEETMSSYFHANRPRHHALHDAHALRLGVFCAIENGWWQKP